MTQIISIDVGRSQVKATNGVKEIVFKSVVGKHRILNVPSNFTDYDVSINGKKHFVSDLAKAESKGREMLTGSKVHDDTKILLLTALCLLVDPKKPFVVITGMPIDQYSPACKTELMKFLTGTHSVVVNGTECEIEINDKNMKMGQESVATYWNEVLDSEGNEIDSHKFLDKVVRVIDIGSRTVNFTTFDKGSYRNIDSNSLDFGTNELTDNPTVSEDDKREFVQQIVAGISRYWADYKNDTFLIAGGGSILLQKYLIEFYPNVIISENPLMANAKGFYKMLAQNV